jgi:hypothetical protein
MPLRVASFKPELQTDGTPSLQNILVRFAYPLLKNNIRRISGKVFTLRQHKTKHPMKKLLCVCLILSGSFFVSHAQSLSDSHGSSTGQIKSDGTVEDSHGSTAGHIRSDGTIEDSHGSTIGHIKSDGTIEDSHGSTIGKVENNGTIDDSHGSTIGHVRSDGTVEDSHGSTIGHASGIKREWVAVAFFFFRFN